MLLNGRVAIASKKNANGLRVFIPLKMRIGGKIYSCPIRIRMTSCAQREAVIYSTGSTVSLGIVALDVHEEHTEPFVMQGVQ